MCLLVHLSLVYPLEYDEERLLKLLKLNTTKTVVNICSANILESCSNDEKETLNCLYTTKELLSMLFQRMTQLSRT